MKKSQIAILISLFVLIVILATVLVFVYSRVSAVKANITQRFEPFEYRDGLLVSPDRTKAMRFVSNMGTYRELDVGIFDLSDYDGAEGVETQTVNACRDSSNLIPLTDNALPYYNLDDSFVYCAPDGEKYIADTSARTLHPLLEGSSAGVVGICTSGEFLMEADGKDFYVLQRQDRTSDTIISRTKIDFGTDYATGEFVGWYNERYAVVKLYGAQEVYFALVDASAGTGTLLLKISRTPLFDQEDGTADADMLYGTGEIVGGRYTALCDCVQNAAGGYDLVPNGHFADIFTGSQYGLSLDKSVFSGQNRLVCVSDGAEYAVYKTSLSGSGNSIEYVAVNCKTGSYMTLDSILGEGYFIDDAVFVYSNVVFVNYAEMSTGKEESCSIKLSF